MQFQTFDIKSRSGIPTAYPLAINGPHRGGYTGSPRRKPLSGLGCENCGGSCSHGMSGETETQQAINVAELLGVGMLAFQAIAALSGLGIFLIQAKAYGDKKRSRK